jgi:FkbM family methyltransferase
MIGMVKTLARRAARACGYDLVRLPIEGSLGAHLAALFARLDINCVLDVGAHVGEYGLFLRGLGFHGHIVSFEPAAASFAVLSEVAGRHAGWTAHRLALGAGHGPVALHVTRRPEFSSIRALRPECREIFGPAAAVERVETVEMRRLSSLFGACTAGIPEPRVYLKMDTQGYDLEVLDGAGSALGAVLALQSEVSVKPLYQDMPDYTASIARLTALGFELTGLFAVSRDRELRMIELDCVMRRSTSSRPPAAAR